MKRFDNLLSAFLGGGAPAPRKIEATVSPEDARLLEQISTFDGTAYGEYADLREKALELAHIVSLRRRFKLRDNGLVERLDKFGSFDMRITVESYDMRDNPANEYTYVHLDRNGTIALSVAGDDQLYEASIRPDGRVSYSNDSCKEFFPRQDVERTLASALRAA